MKELWRPIKNHPQYICSSLCRVKNTKTGKIHNGSINNKGYMRFDLCENGKRFVINAHRLMAETFIPNPQEKPFVNHIDGNKTNNSLNNLEWCTQKENMRHAYDVLHANFGSNRKAVYCVETGFIYKSPSFVAMMFCLPLKSASLNIWRCCAGERKSAYGYHWKFIV